MRRIITASLCAIAAHLGLSTSATAGWGKICNNTDDDLWFARAFDDGLFIWDTNWRYKGWWEIKRGKCYSENLGYATVYYAFMSPARETLVFSVRSTGRRAIDEMCVNNGDGPFNVSVGENPANCPADTTLIPISFGLRGGDNDVSITLE